LRDAMAVRHRSSEERRLDVTTHGQPIAPTLYHRLYRWRRPLVLAVYASIAVAGYLGGFLLRFEFGAFDTWVQSFLWTAPMVALVRLGFARIFHLATGRWRFVSTTDVLRLLVATSVGTLLLVGVRALLVGVVMIPLSVLLIEWVLTTQLTAVAWIGYRTGFERLRRSRWENGDPRRRVLIIGAGEAGNMLAREIHRYPTGYEVVGFVDDEPMKWGDRIQGIEIVGGTIDLPAIAASVGAHELILAVPSAGPESLRGLVAICETTALPFKVLPGIREVLDGEVGLSQLRELRIDDLLGREPIELELPELARDLNGRCVLITGAAGSIGSELARQVALHRPARLVIMDQAETDLFYLDLDLRREHPDVELVPVIGDVVDAPTVRKVFDDHQPERVFHAAAYKHVPLMELNPEQAIRNNVLGTRVVAAEAGRQGCGKFILVSTDKAVQPSSVMGATKRLAEMVVLALDEKYPQTAYGAVRFGNVLGSAGSVIPIFQRQIERSEPLTVTHPDVTRYFMTIPEAVQLILQASLLEELRGHIAMLEMGEPVRIVDLAQNMLRLAGIPSANGAHMIFTGLRPGEKLHEELAAPTEESCATAVPKVRIIRSENGREFPMLAVAERWARLFDAGRGARAAVELRGMFDGLGGEDPPVGPVIQSASPAAVAAGDAVLERAHHSKPLPRSAGR
jgi:FlaA1/EpsC-like NDP-sugar epimerase